MPGNFDFSRLRVPIGSLLVDVGLVLTLIYSAGQLTQRLEHLSERVAAVEQYHVRTNGDARIYVLERRAEEMAEFKLEIRDQLTRIESKVDRLREQH